MNSINDPTLAITPGQDLKSRRGTELKMFGGTFGGPIKKNRIFTFTSFENWDDKRPLTIVRTVPTAAERAGDFSQSVSTARVRTIYNPWTSVINPSTSRVVRTAFANNQIPTSMFDPVAVKMLAADPAAEPAGQRGQPAVHRLREDRLLELLAARRRELHRQLEDVRPLRPVQGRPRPAESDRRAASSRCRAASGTA